jgi:hypothetical protein
MPSVDRGTRRRSDRGRPGTGCRALVIPGLLLAAAETGRWLEPVRRRPTALVESLLFPTLRRPRRLLPQTTSQGVLAGLPGLLYLGAAGDLLSPEQYRPRLHQDVLRTSADTLGRARKPSIRKPKVPCGRKAEKSWFVIGCSTWTAIDEGSVC